MLRSYLLRKRSRMKNKIYEFYRNYYDLDNLKIGISNNDMMFLIYDDEFNYYIKNTRFLLENLGEDSILTISNKLNTKYNELLSSLSLS